MSEVKPLVAIHCLVYNHEPYLRDCFEGFVMQQTNFSFVAIVHDDASTDGSAEIIREYERKYPHIFKPIYEKENQFCKRDGSLDRIMKQAIDIIGAKYVAMCEGDDYWIDPLKLQKQVNFMETNLDYSMCFHSAEIKNETDTKVIINCENIENKNYTIDDIFPGWIIPTASVLYRKKVVDEYPVLCHSDWVKYDDIILFLKCVHTGLLRGINERMSVYRMTNNGFVINQNKDKLSEYKLCKHYECLMLNFPRINKGWIKKYIAQFHYTRFRQEKEINQKIYHFLVGIKMSPLIFTKKIVNGFARLFSML